MKDAWLDFWDVVIHIHLLRQVWRLPLRFHKLVLKLTGCRLTQYSTPVDNIPFRWSYHKDKPLHLATIQTPDHEWEASGDIVADLLELEKELDKMLNDSDHEWWIPTSIQWEDRPPLSEITSNT